jgi:hypothetical protein
MLPLQQQCKGHDFRSEHVFQDGGQHRAGGEALGFQECCVSSQNFYQTFFKFTISGYFLANEGKTGCGRILKKCLPEHCVRDFPFYVFLSLELCVPDRCVSTLGGGDGRGGGGGGRSGILDVFHVSD